MNSRRTAVWVGVIGLITTWVVVGCSPNAPQKDEEPSTEKVTLAQGNTSALVVLVGKSRPGKIEGERNGVTASINEDKSGIFVSAAKDAKVGGVALIVKNMEGKKIATLMVTVKEPEVGLKIHILGRKRATAWQNEETEIRVSVVRSSEYNLFSTDASLDLAVTGKFHGDLKLSSDIVKGGKGLTVKFDPEKVKGSEATSKLNLKADANADLGEVLVKLTATTIEGKTVSTSVTLDVDVAPKKK